MKQTAKQLSDKMGKSMKKAKISATRNNDLRTKVALKDTEALFGRAVKTLGNGRFRITTTDNEGRAIETDAAIAGRSVVRIQIGDVLIVGRNESAKHITYEILGSCDKKAVKQLRDTKRLHPALFSEEDELGDDLFDRSEQIAEEEEAAKPKMEKGNKPAKAPKGLVEDEDDDVNVDAI
jgi:translation initiation factor IF-1